MVYYWNETKLTYTMMNTTKSMHVYISFRTFYFLNTCDNSNDIDLMASTPTHYNMNRNMLYSCMHN